MSKAELEAAIDDAAEREGRALKRANHAKGINILKQSIFSTHKGRGTRAVGPPSGSKMHRRAA